MPGARPPPIRGPSQTKDTGQLPCHKRTHHPVLARRSVKVARPEVVSYGGLTTVTAYHLIPKSEHVVDSVFMHDRFNRTPTGGEENSMVVVTNHRVYTLADGDEDE